MGTDLSNAMNNERREKLITRYLEDPSDARACQALEAEFAADPTLRVSLDEIRQVILLLQSLPKESVPKSFATELVSRLARSPKDRRVSDAREPSSAALREERASLLNGEPSVLFEKNVEDSAETRREIEEMKRVRDLLGQLPGQGAPKEFRGQLLEKLRAEMELSANMASKQESAVSENGSVPLAELLTAYLDDELGDRRRALVARELSESSKARRMVREHEQVRQILGQLPRERAPGSLVRGVMDEVALEAEPQRAAEIFVADGSPFVPPPRPLAARLPGDDSWRGGWAFLGVAGTVAAALALFISMRGESLIRLSPRDATVPSISSRESVTSRPGESRKAKPRVELETPGGSERPPLFADASEGEEPKESAHVVLDDGPIALASLASLDDEELRDLEQRTIQLWSNDAAHAGQRLWIVLNDNQVTATEVPRGSSSDPVTIEVRLTAHQLAEVLDDLSFAERNRPLFVRVGMSGGVHQAVEPAVAAVPVDTIFRPVDPLVMPVDERGRPMPKLPDPPPISNAADHAGSNRVDSGEAAEAKKPPARSLSDRFLVRLQLRSEGIEERK